jgi:ribose transport system substrate-binding protein
VNRQLQGGPMQVLSRAGAIRKIAATAFVLALAGCGGSAAPSTGVGHTGKTIAYVSFGQQYGYQVALVAAVQKAATAAGMKVQLYDGQGDANAQSSQIRTALSLHPNALIIDPVAPALVSSGVALANTDKIPVFILDSPPPTGDVVTLIANDSSAGGKSAGEEMAKLDTSQQRVLEVMGAVGSTQVGLRSNGFKAGLSATQPNTPVQELKAEWSAQKAVSLVLDAFTVNPAVGGIWSNNDDMMGGAVQALQKLGKTAKVGEPGHVALVSLDGDPLALQRIRDHVQDATMASNVPKVASSMIDAIVSYLDTGSAPKTVMIPYVLVDSSNAADPNLWGNAK